MLVRLNQRQLAEIIDRAILNSGLLVACQAALPALDSLMSEVTGKLATDWLALTLTDEYLAEVEATLDKVRQVFDRDGDAGVGFDLRHAEGCPAYGWKVQPGACGCGLITTLDEIQHALATLRTAREQVRTLREASGK